MNNIEKTVDYNTWNRKEIYEFFSGVSNPFYMVSFTVDVTGLQKYCREKGLSFYLCMIYICTEAVNSIENFRYKKSGEDIVLLKKRTPSFTDMKKGEELFHITTIDCPELMKDLETFVAAARKKSEEQTCFINYQEEAEDLIYYSCLPGLRMTALTNERELKKPSAAEGNIPSICWGKYEKRGDRLELIMSMEVNHRFIDGIHITRFAEAVEESIERLQI